MNSLHHFCRGDSHLATDKPCQDYAYSESSEKLSMAIVSDGHGGERYFRSQYGAEMAVRVTRDAIRCFVETMHESAFNKNDRQSVFEGKAFTSCNSNVTSEKLNDSNTHAALRLLFSSIIYKWNQAITQHALANEVTEWEKLHVAEKYVKEFAEKRSRQSGSFEKTYGCTLMAYIQTPQYWFAFHIGDGKCITMQTADGRLSCEQPIPWDDRCFLNKTTSLCDADAIDEFRYCFSGDGSFPIAVFLGSDGLDDSYGDGENLNNFYIQLYKAVLRYGKENALKELEQSLPIISQKGSKDDMSVAMVFNDKDIRRIFLLLNAYQLEQAEKLYDNIERKVLQLQQQIDSFGNLEMLDRHEQISQQYACNSLVRAMEQAKQIKSKKTALQEERKSFEHEFQSSAEEDFPVQ